MTTITCPRCQKQTEWSSDNPYRPFCSNRCKMSDLDGWLTEEYALPANDEESPDLPTDDH